MAYYLIYAGLGGGFGGCTPQEIREFNSKEYAEDYARAMAMEVYEGYMGLHGIRSIEQIMEQDEVSEDEAYQICDEEVDSWIDYLAEEVYKNEIDGYWYISDTDECINEWEDYTDLARRI